MTAGRWVAGAIAAALLVQSAVIGYNEAPTAAGLSGALTVTAPSTTTAGESVPVTVIGASGDDVLLTAVTSLGAVEQRAAAAGGPVQFTLGADITGPAGEITVFATSADALATASVLVTPGPTVDPITPVVGARSIVADAADRSMAVAMPADSFGNTVADGSALELMRQHPDGTVTAATVTVAHLLTWGLLPAGTRAGSNQIFLQDGAVSGPAVTLDEVAAPPLPFTLAPVDPQQGPVAADGQSLVAVHTSVLADGFGNVEPDGTLVSVDWTGPQGPSRTQAQTIAGVAAVSIPAPAVPASVSVTASCRGSVTAAPLVLTFVPAVQTVPVVAVRGMDSVQVTVGPVLRTGGAFVPDGTIAAVTVTDQAGKRLTANGPLVGGSLQVTVAGQTSPGPVTVFAEVLGAFGNVTVP